MPAEEQNYPVENGSIANDFPAKKLANKKTRPQPAVRRSLARLLAVQAMYEIEMAGAKADQLIEDYIDNRIYDRTEEAQSPDFTQVNKKFFRNLVKGCLQLIPQIDEIIEQKLDNRNIAQTETILLIILRLGIYETIYMENVKNIAKAFFINEYIELTKIFFYNDSPALVNAILDAIVNDEKQGKTEGEAKNEVM